MELYIFGVFNHQLGLQMSAEHLSFQTMNLNVRHDAPQEIWDKVGLIYEKPEGWMDYDNNIPYRFGFDEAQKHICASEKPAGLRFSGLMPEQEGNRWRASIKTIAIQILGYKVGEVAEGEVEF